MISISVNLTITPTSAPGSSDYGAGGSMVVSAAAEGGQIYLTAQGNAGEFTTVIAVATTSVISTTIIAGTNEIHVDDLAPHTALPTLSALPETDSIIVEIA